MRKNGAEMSQPTDVYPSFVFEMPTRVEFGRGSLEKLAPLALEMGVDRVMVVTDPGVGNLDFFNDLVSGLEQGGVKTRVFDQVSANPRDAEVVAGAEAARKFKAQALVAVGGGSPIDCAKAMAVVAPFGGGPRDYEKRGSIPLAVLPILAVPTTAGTGSEVTFSSVITDVREKYKFSIKGPQLAPKIAIVDPATTLSMPPSITAATGMDALTHAIEGCTAKNATCMSDAAGLHAITMICENLEKAVQNGGNMTARSGMLLGSLLAGICFSRSDVGAVHCIAEAMGGILDAPHGACNAVALPEVMAYNLPFCTGRYARVARAMGLEFDDDAKGAEMAVAHVRDLARRVNLPLFSSFGLKESDLPVLAEKSEKNGSNQNNPRPMGATDYMEVLKALLRRQ